MGEAQAAECEDRGDGCSFDERYLTDRTTILNANAALSLSDVPMMLAFGLLFCCDVFLQGTRFLRGVGHAVSYKLDDKSKGGKRRPLRLGGSGIEPCCCAAT